MNPLSSILSHACLTVLMAGLRLHAAEGQAGFPEVAGLLAEPDDIRFLAKFCPYLESLPADRISDLTKALEQGWKDKSLPTTHREAARRMTALRLAAAEPAAALSNPIPNAPSAAVLTALKLGYARDPEATLAKCRELAAAGHGDPVTGFLAWLAEENPSIAIREVGRIHPIAKDAAALSAAVFSSAEIHDPQTTWDALKQAGMGEETAAARGVVLATIGRTDLPVAIRLWRSLDRGDLASATLREWFIHWGTRHPDLSPTLAREIGTAFAWQTCGATLGLDLPEKNLGRLLAAVPPDMLESALTGFFLIDNPRASFGFHPRFRNLPLLAKVPSPGTRAKLMQRIVKAQSDTGSPLPRALVDIILAEHPADALASWGNVASSHIMTLLAAAPERSLAWFMRLDAPEWEDVAPTIGRNWPYWRLGADGPRLAKSQNPREARIGVLITEKWLYSDPCEAFDYWLGVDPAQLSNPSCIDNLARCCRGDFQRVEALIGRLPTDMQRESARETLRNWKRKHANLYTDLSDIGTMMEQASPDFPEIARRLGSLANRDLAEIDEWIARLPADCEGGDQVRSARGLFLLRVGRPEKALAVWRKAASPAEIIKAIRSVHSSHLGIGGAGEIIGMLAAFPKQNGRDEAIDALFGIEIKAGWASAVRLAESPQPEDVRLILLKSLLERAATAARLEDVRRLAGETPNKEISSGIATARAQVDPVGTWRDALRLPPGSAEANRQIDSARLVLAQTDPQRIPGLLMESPAHALRNADCVRMLANFGARFRPALAYSIARAYHPDAATTIMGIWSAGDPAAACAAAFAANPEGHDTIEAFEAWNAGHPDDAIAWMKARPAFLKSVIRARPRLLIDAGPDIAGDLAERPITRDEIDASQAIARQIATTDYPKAADFLTKMILRVEKSDLAKPQPPAIPQGDVEKMVYQPLVPLIQLRREILAKWLLADPPAAKAFVAEHLPGADLAEIGDENDSGPGDLLEPKFFRLTTAKGVSFAAKQLGGVEPHLRSHAIRGIAAAAVRSGSHEEVSAVLGVPSKLNSASPEDVASLVATEFLTINPDGLLPWLRTLPGTALHNRLPVLVSTILYASRREPHLGSLAVGATRILMAHPLPEAEDPAVTAGILLSTGRTGQYRSAISAVVKEGQPDDPNTMEHLDLTVSALASGHPEAALAHASGLPSPEFDDIIFRIVAAIPPARRADAIRALPAAQATRPSAYAALLAASQPARK